MKKIMGCILCLYSLLGYSAEMVKMNVNVDAQQFKIALPANPTTGYQWTVMQYDKTILKLTSEHFVAPLSKRIGAGGEMNYIFSRVKGATYPKSTIMVFRYARSWEHGRGIEKRVVVNFK